MAEELEWEGRPQERVQMSDKRTEKGKAVELRVAAKLIEAGLDVFLPLRDRGIDLVVQSDDHFYGVQVKSIKGYNRIVGLSVLPDILVVVYQHKDRDEYLWLSREQIERHWLRDSEWKDVVLNQEERDIYEDQTIESVIKSLHSEVRDE